MNDRSVTARKKRTRSRDLNSAIMLRPRDVFTLYGIPPSTLSMICNDPDSNRGLPSIKIPGRCGRRGIRLIDHGELRVGLTRWTTGAR